MDHTKTQSGATTRLTRLTLLNRNTELERVAALHRLGILNSDTSAYFDSVTALAAQLFGTAGAYISLLDGERQWLKSTAGFCAPARATPRDQTFCDHTIRQASVLVVEDTLRDARFAANPMVTGPERIRFYAGAPLLTADGHAVGALCLVDRAPRALDAAGQAQLARLAALAMAHIELGRAVGQVDAVSGMANKYRMEEDLALLGQTPAGGQRVLLMLDMPDAATALEIASVLGVQAYDRMIRAVGARLKTVFGERARIYHVTDARFAILSGDEDSAGFIDFVHACAPALAAPLPLAAQLDIPLNLASYGGIVVFDPGLDAAGDAPRRAAAAAGAAFLGRQRWQVYDQAADDRQRRAFRLLNDVRAGLAAGHFHLVYQPKHTLDGGACLSAEALLRWSHPELGAVSPAEFIPLIEKTALIGPLTDWIIHAAIVQLAQWHAHGYPIKLAINLSAYNFEEADIVERLAGACARHGVAPRHVEIECTEGIWMESPRVLATLHAIRALGMSLALDDFGTGYSNFAYLQQVPATVIKLDQSLIRNVHSSARDQRIVRSLIALARELDYEVVAEGVETAQSLALIREWGCDVAQGYHFARPLPAAEFIAHVARHDAVPAAA